MPVNTNHLLVDDSSNYGAFVNTISGGGFGVLLLVQQNETDSDASLLTTNPPSI
jgi:hypothetical protein